ncbi:MmgE/PrpD family protein [Neorhizobium galegae bv. orientalis]|nr:MmgE/PrpD family protein [Neorhizobium galegae bv. orientalis]CDZ67279.1 MmgE/PrpD family protein [Neorhizobium galegae bv. orientalis]
MKALQRAFSDQINDDHPSSIVGGLRAPVSLAALVNGTAAHSLDFDDNFHPARAHASAVLVPALLAVAGGDRSITGRNFLSAYLAGLEAQAAVGFGVNPSHYNAGWHATSTVGCIGAAAGVAILLRATETEVAHAMSIAVSLSCGLKGQFGTMVKPVHAGVAARNAVEAALMAKAGLEARLDILEGRQGFLELSGGEDAKGWKDLVLASEHVIETRGLVTKRHPCCGSTHRAIDALLELKKRYDLDIADIRGIDTQVGISAQRNLAYADPKDEMEARFSMQYCLATAFIHGKLRLSDFTPEAAVRLELRDLMSRISMTAYTPEQEKGVERLPHRVTVITCDGRHISVERLHAKGAIEAPLDEADREYKFRDCLSWANISGHQIPSWQSLSDLQHTECVAAALPFPR